MTTGMDGSKAQEPILVDNIKDLVVDFQGRVKKLLIEASRADKAIAPSADWNRARRHLSASQNIFVDLQETMLQELLSYERLAELAALGTSSGPQWLKWT